MSPKDLETHDCILFSPISTSEWRLQSAKRSVIVQLPGKIIVNDINLALNFTLQGEGISLLPSFLCQAELKSGRLVRVLEDWRSNKSPVHFVYPAQRYVSPAVKMFIEMSTHILKNRFRIFDD